MSLLIGFLTFILVLNCLLLMLLILIQLPKKEAGAGIAFGGAATDALFGAGSGNALTRLTKYAGSSFVFLSIVLSVLNMQAARQGSRRLEQELNRQASTPAAVTPPGITVTPIASTTNTASQTTPLTSSTNLMLTLPTNAPANAPALTAPIVTPEEPIPATTPAPATPEQP